MLIIKIEVGGLGTNCYLIGCEYTLEGAIIDPGGNTEKIIREITGYGLKIKYIINTHGHGDHIAANGKLKELTGAQILIHEQDQDYLSNSGKNLTMFMGEALNGPPADRFLRDGDRIEIGKSSILEILHTPGHTPGGICLVDQDNLFTGDTLFAGSIGRTDFPGGSYHSLIESVKNKLFSLEGDRKVFPGHGPETTLKEEKETNPFFK